MYKLTKKLNNSISKLPRLHGCYIYRDKEDKIIYIGKANDLKSRVSSYFLNYETLEPKRQRLVENINSIEIKIVDSETESLILESNLIKKYRPKYNKLLVDDKNYSWIKLSSQMDFPKVEITRIRINDSNDYFGPYPLSYPIKEVLKKLRKIFPYRSCNRRIIFSNEKNICSNPKPCLFYYIGLCDGPCASYINKKDYRKKILNIKRFLKSEKDEILIDLEKKMKFEAKKQNYEKAKIYRDRLLDIKYVLKQVKWNRDVDDISIDQIKFNERKKSINNLFEKLEIKLPANKEIKFECYDISNIQGKNPVASMTVMINGIPAKNLYRKFKIKKLDTPNDVEMMKEVLYRRFTNKQDDNSFIVLPDLIIVDGGKGQLKVCSKVLESLKINIPHIGLAKREEEIFIIRNNEFNRIHINKKSESLKLLQRIRDEAHRFGIAFHKKLRSKSMFNIN